jgi:hypothetical protein
MTYTELSQYTYEQLSNYTYAQLSTSLERKYVYDRTQGDVDRAVLLQQRYINGSITEVEKEEWMQGLKGCLNYADLNRVESNCSYLAENIAVFVVTKGWERIDIPRASDFQRIRNNVDAIRNGFAVFKDTPRTPSVPLNTFEKWNDIEKILYDVDMIYHRTMDAFIYCGESYAGEDIGVI